MNSKNNLTQEVIYFIEEDLADQEDLHISGSQINGLISEGNCTFLVEEKDQSNISSLISLLGF
jgi:hypothetical protein